MPTASINGGTVVYEVLGTGDPVFLTPGGRFSRNVPGLRPLAEELAAHFTVVLWDRRNTGESSMYFGGPSESLLWADDLAQLVTQLEMAPAYLAGGSAGSRTSLVAALRHPEIARKLVLWLISGGIFGQLFLPVAYNIPFIVAARRGGMEAVAKLPEFAEQMARNPKNRDYLLSLDVGDFIETMKRWMSGFIPREDQPIPGVSYDELNALPVPTLVFRGSDIDDFHPRQTSEAIAAALPNCELAEPPWAPGEWEHLRIARDEGRGNIFDNWPRLAPQIVAFLKGAE